ncbi:MAG TPA: TonB family protein [Bacteroidota bacterium]|nr:TonB family protein [Bacteroidota bacterium]
MPPDLAKTRHQFDLRLKVNEDGSVARADILDPSGDAVWDSLALSQIAKWKFAPALDDGKPIPMWITMRANVKFEQPILMDLAEIVCRNASIADSVYSLLNAGASFESLVSTFSISHSKDRGGNLGEIDLCRYSDDIRKTLKKLGTNEFSEPIALGDTYVIFRRLKGNVQFQ